MGFCGCARWSAHEWRRARFFTALTLLAGTALASIPMSSGAWAATAPADADNLSEIIVTGTRRIDRSVADSPSPVDVFTPEDLERQAGSDTQDLIRTLVPSFNVGHFSSDDGSGIVRPPTLRGLPPDETLVLINGKRFHRSALVQIAGDAQTSGSQGADLNQIPAIAIKQLEVLRDGASAQYGSDAIAGVMNFTLKDAADGGSVIVQWGQDYAGDGGTGHIQVNSGLPLGDRGFVNISAEYQKNDPTDRGVERSDVTDLKASGYNPGPKGYPTPNQRWGDNAVEAERLFINSGIDLTDNSKIYLFGNFGHSNEKESFYYRDPVSSWLGTTFPLTSGGNFSWASVYPGGYHPWFYGDILDSSITGGYKTTLKSGLIIDASASYGRDEVRYNLTNTVNPSLGPSSPTQFYVGTQTQEETDLNLDLTYPVHIDWLASALTLAGGAEYRRETYTITPGDAASYTSGAYAAYVPVGSNGMPGFTPTDAGQFPRSNYAFYADAEADVIKDLSLGFALRYEDFSDFGNTTNWKVTGRYQLTDWLAVRSSVNTGFRAPTPGQENVSKVTTIFQNGNPVEQGTYPVGSAIARYYGAQALKPETSFNIAGGLVFDLPYKVNLTVDYYNIKVEDRIGITSTYSVTAADIVAQPALAAVGVGGQVNYFANGFDTRTQGVDIVANKTFDLDTAGELHATAAMNINHTVVTKYNPTVIGLGQVQDLQNESPHYRATLTGVWDIGKFSILGRASYFGAWEDNVSICGTTCLGQNFDPAWIFDAEVSYKVLDDLTASIGGQNVGDKYPAKIRPEFGTYGVGQQYSFSSPYGYDGGYYYVRLKYDF
ncbi:iron complex outermembrane receptor protein [Nitrospirillum viridazoti]|uniref:Iron complex outermembrane receptor protein n=2 Tax=Nitrospirillum TaxID=1543705 RepID=A0A560HL45_9PROT|nr:iron complex outermembrane receptor protein [Nitrospirillum amazonense]